MRVADPVTKNKLEMYNVHGLNLGILKQKKAIIQTIPNGGSIGVLFSLNTAAKLTEERTISWQKCIML